MAKSVSSLTQFTGFQGRKNYTVVEDASPGLESHLNRKFGIK